MFLEIPKCKECGFILKTRPGLKDLDGVCLACINIKNKINIDFAERQKWLTEYIKDNILNPEYDCLVAVSGGKDSTFILKKLFETHGVNKVLLVHLSDNFTHTQTGKENLENIINMRPKIENTDSTKIIFDSNNLKENSEFDLKSKEKK